MVLFHEQYSAQLSSTPLVLCPKPLFSITNESFLNMGKVVIAQVHETACLNDTNTYRMVAIV